MGWRGGGAIATPLASVCPSCLASCICVWQRESHESCELWLGEAYPTQSSPRLICISLHRSAATAGGDCRCVRRVHREQCAQCGAPTLASCHRSAVGAVCCATSCLQSPTSPCEKSVCVWKYVSSRAALCQHAHGDGHLGPLTRPVGARCCVCRPRRTRQLAGTTRNECYLHSYHGGK